MSKSKSFFGSQEVVELDSTGLGTWGGYYTFYFGPPSIQLPGDVQVNPGQAFMITSRDLTKYLSRGEEIFIDNKSYFIHKTKIMSSCVIPLSEAYNSPSDSAAKVFVRSKSMNIPYDASALILSNALENMVSIGQVNVMREIGFPHGYKWKITFVSNAGDQPVFIIDSAHLLGNNTHVKQREIIKGFLPNNYLSSIFDSNTTSAIIFGLIPGLKYYVRVRSTNDQGDSIPAETTPEFITPGQAPNSPSIPALLHFNNNILLVKHEEQVDSNGGGLSHFILEVDIDQSFVNATKFETKVDNSIQRITTGAHSIPWDQLLLLRCRLETFLANIYL